MQVGGINSEMLLVSFTICHLSSSNGRNLNSSLHSNCLKAVPHTVYNTYHSQILNLKYDLANSCPNCIHTQPSRMFYFHVQTCNLGQVQIVSLILFTNSKKSQYQDFAVDNHCWVILSLVVVVLSSFSVLITEYALPKGTCLVLVID